MTYEPAISVPLPAREASPDFATFYADWYSRVARYCFRLVRDEELARDITQESFARLYTRWLGLRAPDAYLFHVATNLARATWSRQQRENAALVESSERAVPTDHRDIHLAVAALPRRYRELVLLYYFADLPIAAVAAAVRRPEGTVKRQLAEARQALATDLEA